MFTSRKRHNIIMHLLFVDFSARSGGHGQIETVDHFKYSFNGHGEYVFLRYNDSKA